MLNPINIEESLATLKLKVSEANDLNFEVKQIVDKLTDYLKRKQEELDHICEELDLKLIKFHDGFDRPTILSSYGQMLHLIKLCRFSSDITSLKLVYRASEDGFAAKCFHKKCDGIKDTLTLIKTTNG